MKPMTDKVALVTGGGSGIGRAVASLFAERGARVVVADFSPEGGRQTVDAIIAMGGDAGFIHSDVTRADDVAAMIAETVSTFGRLDYAHNNAGGTTEFAPLADTSEDYWHKCIAVHLTGVWLCLKYQIVQMVSQGGGAIVNTSSIAGLFGACNASAYSAAKHGVIGLTRSAAVEYATQGIRVNAVCPGGILTPIVEEYERQAPEASAIFKNAHAMKRYGQPPEVAEAVVWLCSDAATFITGTAIPVDGGLTAAAL